jgi:hypothetical protein
MRPVSTDNLSLLTSLLKDLEIVGMTNIHARELDGILRRPHIRVTIYPKNVFFFLNKFVLDDYGCSSNDSNKRIC